jgi:hypothetical protein
MATKVKKTNGRPATKAKPARAQKIHTVIAQDWEESERGWGTRPDGFTLHLTPEAHRAYVDAFWKRQKAYFDKSLGEGVTPEEYTRTSGDPRKVDVNATIYKKLLKHKDKLGLWGNGRSSPAHLLKDTDDVNVPS